MQKIKDILRLVRWQNLLFIGILLWVMEKWVAVPVLNRLGFGEEMPWYVLLLLIVAAVLEAAGGYVINDYFDVKIDRINRPDSLIVTNSVNRTEAVWLGWSLSVLGVLSGIIVSFLVRSWSLTMVFFMVPGLLWFYSSSYKRLFLIGNITIAFISALTPMLIAFANIGLLRLRYAEILRYLTLEHDLYCWLGGFSLFAFLGTWIREIIKDLQDQMGDRELECHSLPIRLGERWTKIIVTLLIVFMVLLLLYIWCVALPFPPTLNSLSSRYVLCGILIPLSCELWLLWAARIPSDYRQAQLLMKFIMFIGMLYSFVIMRTL